MLKMGDPSYQLTGVTCNVVKTETSVIYTMAETSQRMEEIESKLSTIKNYLFGSEPCDDSAECKAPHEPNVRSLANEARYSTNRIIRMLDEIYNRLAQ